MSALEGFRTMWSHAHATFGQGTPVDGAAFDQSDTLYRLRDTVKSAGRQGTWTGSASDSYAEANGKQVQLLGGIANLDKRLAAAVVSSASVVMAGRRDLDGVRQWVDDVASRVPKTPAGERMLHPVISKGSSDIQSILQRSNADLATIAARIRDIAGEYDELGAGGAKLDKLDDAVPPTALDLDDIVYLKPFDPKDSRTQGPAGYKELVPNSGVWVPDPRSPFFTPTPVKKPLDLDDVVQVPPYGPDGAPTIGPDGYVELVPHSGTWVPDPNGPMWPNDPPTAPVDLNKIVVADPRALGEPWQIELIPNSGVWVPNPHYGGPR